MLLQQKLWNFALLDTLFAGCENLPGQTLPAGVLSTLAEPLSRKVAEAFQPIKNNKFFPFRIDSGPRVCLWFSYEK
jgi:hypothetical protein